MVSRSLARLISSAVVTSASAEDARPGGEHGGEGLAVGIVGGGGGHGAHRVAGAEATSAERTTFDHAANDASGGCGWFAGHQEGAAHCERGGDVFAAIGQHAARAGRR